MELRTTTKKEPRRRKLSEVPSRLSVFSLFSRIKEILSSMFGPYSNVREVQDVKTKMASEESKKEMTQKFQYNQVKPNLKTTDCRERSYERRRSERIDR